MSRRTTTALRVALLLVAGSSLLGPGPAVAQEAEDGATLAGYQGSGAASGVRAKYNPEGLLPISAPVDLGVPDALATIASGPTTFARASVADPGDLLANPSALLGLAEPSLSGSVPPYPFRVSATSGLGHPTAEVTPAPGLNARAAVEEGGSRASANMPGLDAPAVMTVGSVSASASTQIDGSTIVVKARTSVADIDVLGLLVIDSIVTDLTATSGDGEPTLVGGTRAVGASILGQPVTIDANGIRSGNGSTPNPIVEAIDQALQSAGIRIAVASPVELAGGTSGQLVAAGLRIDLELSDRTVPAIGDLLDVLPPMDALLPGLPSVEDVLAVARARHLATLAVGGASVALTTRTVEPMLDPVPIDPVVLPSFVSPDLGLTPVPAVVPGRPARGPAAPTTRPISAGLGEGLGLAALALLLAPLLGDRLARWTTSYLAADAATTCPREGPR